MYKVLIVDDEKIERNGIKFLLKQTGIDCEMAEAVNGKAALEYIENNDVDILLTDVKMPIMDGIELIGEVTKLNKVLKYVIFSGCNEFDYAKQAVRLGVSDYILKPVDPDEFSTTIDKVINELEELKAETELKTKSIEYMNEHMLFMLVNGASLEEIEKYNNNLLPMDFLNKYKKLMLIEFNKDFYGNKEMDFKERILERFPKIKTYLNLNQTQSLVLFETLDVNFVEYANLMAEFVKETYSENCYIAISDLINGVEDIAVAIDMVEELMENKFYHKDIQVYYAGMKHEQESMIEFDDDTLIKQMKQDVKMKDSKSLRTHFDKFCTKYQRKNDFSQMYIKFLFSNLLSDFNNNIPDSDEKILDSEIESLYKAGDFDTVRNIVLMAIDKLEKTFEKNPQMVHREIEIVKQYIYDHFGEELSVDALADMVYMAPSYLSAVFKKETGQNLCKFIKAYRMEQAKYMLENSMQKIVDIGLNCGYVNVSYFCSSFREYFGVSPQKFRENGEA